MSLPGFNAELSLGRPRRTYHGRYDFAGQNLAGPLAEVLPAQLEEGEDLDADEVEEIFDEDESEIEED